MSKQSVLRKYFSIADYIAAINGPSCEVIVHDISNLQKSIVYLVNGHVTNRKVGGTITDFALDLIMNKEYESRESVVNYMGTTKDGKILRSSTYFIRDDEKKLIGLLCVNFDITDLLKARDIINSTLVLPAEKQTSADLSKEHFNLSVDELVDGIMDNVILGSGISMHDSNAKQKKELTRLLADRGVFKLKGAVGAVARKLNTSSQTVYRYVSEIEEEIGEKTEKEAEEN